MIANPTKARCPQCGGPVAHHAQAVMPFCSIRCQQIDLRRWLGEEYGLPHETDDDEAEGRDGVDTLYGNFDA